MSSSASRRVGVDGMMAAIASTAPASPDDAARSDDLAGVPAMAVNGDLLRHRLQSAETANIDLRRQLDEAAAAPKEVMLDARRVRLSALVDRAENAFGDARFKALVDDMREVGGNVVHVVVRPVAPVKGADGPTHEVLYGQRRWAASVALGTPLRAFEVNVDDRRAVEIMRAENSQRAKLSDYEVAMRAKRYTDMGIYPSLPDAFRSERVSKSAASKLQAIVEIPAGVYALMKDPRQMTQRWAQDIRAAARQCAEGEEAFYAPLLSPPEGSVFKPASLSVQDVREVLGVAAGVPEVKGRTVFGPEQGRNVELVAPREGGRTAVVIRAELSDEQLDALGQYVESLRERPPE